MCEMGRGSSATGGWVSKGTAYGLMLEERLGYGTKVLGMRGRIGLEGIGEQLGKSREEFLFGEE